MRKLKNYEKIGIAFLLGLLIASIIAFFFIGIVIKDSTFEAVKSYCYDVNKVACDNVCDLLECNSAFTPTDLNNS
jgi:hypothetical protein